MSLEKIKQLVNSLNKTIEGSEKIATSILVNKLAKYAEIYPEDQTIGQIFVVVEKLALNNSAFLKKADLKNLYNTYYSRNSKFAELFEKELGITEEQSSVTYMPKDEGKVTTYEISDPILANALNSIFDSNVEFKPFSKKAADRAKFEINLTLDSWNLKPSTLEVDAGNDKFLVIKAGYETPKGLTSFYIPVQVTENRVSEASGFIGNTGLLDLDYKSVRNYITKSAGSKSNFSGKDVLDTLIKASTNKREMSGAELALIRVNASRQVNSQFFDNQIVGQKMEETSVKDVELPNLNEFSSFEEQFTSSAGQAEFKFGKNVKIARDYIARELTSFGFKNPQISILKSDESTIYYGTSLNSGKFAFTIPVKIADNKVSRPNYVLCNGSLTPFNATGLSSLLSAGTTDYKIAAASSASRGMTPGQLISEIKTAIAENNNDKAEDCLNVLANTASAQEYALGFRAFSDSLTKKADKVEIVTQCNMLLKNSTSQQAICGHTGLTINKVYQDRHGNCQPLYRKGMDESYQGAIFNNSKMFG